MKIKLKILSFLVGLLAFSAQAAEQYNGVYYGRRVISKSLADFCQIADDTVASDMKALKECMIKLAAKQHDGEPKVQEEGKKEYQQILLDQNLYLAAQAKLNNANANNYLDDYQKALVPAAHSEGADIHTRETGIAATTEKQMTPMLDATALLGEKIKADVLWQAPQMTANDNIVLPASGDTENVEFSGMYENVQVVPNSLAIYCQLNGSDFVDKEKQEQVTKCIDMLITKINSTSETEREDNQNAYRAIVEEQGQYAFMQAVERSTGRVDYAKARQQQDKDNSETLTVFETTTSMASASLMRLEEMIDYARLYNTDAKYTALRNVVEIDAAAVAGDIKASGIAPKEQDFEASSTTESVTVKVTQPQMEEVNTDDEPTQSSETKSYDDGKDSNSVSESENVDYQALADQGNAE